MPDALANVQIQIRSVNYYYLCLLLVYICLSISLSLLIGGSIYQILAIARRGFHTFLDGLNTSLFSSNPPYVDNYHHALRL